MLMRIQSETCPYCGSKEQSCAIEVETAPTFDMLGKTSESRYVGEFLGRAEPYREAYIVHQIICTKPEKKRKR